MRYRSIVLFLLLSMVPTASFADERLTPRPLDPVAAEIFEQALERSAIVRSLVATLEASDVIVHIVSSRVMRAGIAGTTRFVASRGGYRYVRITINGDLPPLARSAILGHELQHACEIALSPASDTDGIRRLFEQHGQRAGEFYETAAAKETERLVLTQLLTARTLAADSVVKFDD